MQSGRRSPAQKLLFALLLLCLPATAQQGRPKIRVDNYVIDAELVPKTHKLIATAKVDFTALEDIATATFELHNALRPTKITNAKGQTLSAERVTQDSTLRVALPAGLQKGESSTLNFAYEGTLENADESPVEGLKLAYVGDETSYLLYGARWFPVSNFGLNRFTATIDITVPAGMKVIGSGSAGPAKAAAAGKQTYSFNWRPHASFPGTIIAGNFVENTTRQGSYTVRTYVKPSKKEFAGPLAETAGKELDAFAAMYGATLSGSLNVVELPDDTVPAAWAPEIAAVASRAVGDKINYRLLANTIAHQWWGSSVSAVSKADYWIVDGISRYSEMRYVEMAAGRAGMEQATTDMAVGALAYDNVALSSVGRLDFYSPEFQSLVTEKGGMLVHMLRWVLGDAAFDRTMKTIASQNAGKAITTDQFRQVAEANHDDKLTAFFAQWYDGTGAPDFKNKYAVYRLGKGKGFRVVGEITQDLDLFKMPMEVRIDTDGQPEMKRIEVVGTKSPYSIETFGKPRKISLDPNNWVLKNSDELKVRVAILRGQQQVAQGDYIEALKEYNKALDENKQSSLAHYRIAEVFFLQRNYQSAANAYRESLNGDGEPRCTEVWSHIQLGKIFDVTGQRERATNEYRQALQTNDNTQGALDEARKYLEKPYSRERVNAENR